MDRPAAGQWAGQVDYLVVFTAGRYALFDDTGARLAVAAGLEAAGPTLLAALHALRQRLGRRAANAALKVTGDDFALLRQLAGEEPASDPRSQALNAEIHAALAAFLGYRLGQQPAEAIASLLDR